MCFLCHHAEEEVLLNEIELELKEEGIISMYHGQFLPFIIIHQKVWGRSMSGILINKRRIKVAC